MEFLMELFSTWIVVMLQGILWFALWAFILIGGMILFKANRLYKISEAVIMPTILDDEWLIQAARDRGIKKWEERLRERGN